MTTVVSFVIDGVVELASKLTVVPVVGDHHEIGSTDPSRPKVVLVTKRIWKRNIDDFYQRCDLICEVIKEPRRRAR